MTQTLVLLRHAHRDTSRRELDNGLDDKGREQAKHLRRFFMERFSAKDLESGLWLVSSPKLRCRETLLPIAKEIGRQVDTHPDLNEQMARESEKGLVSRIQRFLEEWRHSQIPLTVVCSHGDWLPLASQQLFGFSQESRKGAWLEVESSPGACSLKWYIPSFKPFYK